MSANKSEYVVFEDFEKAVGPKVHNTDCYLYQRWLTYPTTTTTWHGPYATIVEADDICNGLCRGTNFEPRNHSCIIEGNIF